MTSLTPSNLFFSKNDCYDLRLGDLVKRQYDPNCQWVLTGYCDDRGIQNNGGRIGAKEAPLKIREILYKMTPHSLATKQLSLSDAGNFSNDKRLLDMHEDIKLFVQETLDKKHNLITLGGGHDFAYADGAGFLLANRSTKLKPLVINFDAHLDVRPVKSDSDNDITSGTPFYRLISEFKNEFEFLEVGLQPHCNSPQHLQWLKKNKGKYIFIDEINKTGLLSSLKKKIKAQKKRPLYISLDMDVLATWYAPGTSQSWPTGVDLNSLLKTLVWLQQNFDLKILGIYEASPVLDIDNMTAKAAALIIHQTLFINGKND